ncbi:hypothetical protein L5M28_01130 [Shewanella sp. SW32]|uniref:hypothetical protein n=1 Tax=unclassified Shewanella TaxID=196818 RepID=UPI0021D9EC89|nr:MULTISPECIES: hypothetical protein [unclassified Shewanella]MCU7961196.1 hypothetical protein [Shewanella sp. SW32]MCU7969278.1 hypothetical protein [Shewanella sp. SW29]
MTKRRVFLDGNGSSQINVEGLGAYVPATDLLDVKQKLGTEIQQLKDQVNAMQLERSTHIDDIGIDRFTNAMRLKMAYARSKGRSGWNDQALCSGEQLAAALVEHLSKGNAGTFEDIANFAMMLHQRKESPSLLVDAIGNLNATAGNKLEALRDSIQACENQGYRVMFGNWQVTGAILSDSDGVIELVQE